MSSNRAVLACSPLGVVGGYPFFGGWFKGKPKGKLQFSGSRHVHSWQVVGEEALQRYMNCTVQNAVGCQRIKRSKPGLSVFCAACMDG